MGEEDHQLAKQGTGLDAGQVIRWKSCQRRTAICLLAYIYLAIAVAVQRRQEAGSDLDAGPIPITVPELLGFCATPSSWHLGQTSPTGFQSAGGSRRPPRQTRSREPVSVDELR
jgi:hypothetical protein